MKTFKKLAAATLCLTLTAVSPISAFAADSYSWNFNASPSNNETPRIFYLDYSSKGYTTKTTSKSGDTGTNHVILECNAYGKSSSTYGFLADITETNHLFTFDKPDFNLATPKFKATFYWENNKTAINKGIVARR